MKKDIEHSTETLKKQTKLWRAVQTVAAFLTPFTAAFVATSFISTDPVAIATGTAAFIASATIGVVAENKKEKAKEELDNKKLEEFRKENTSEDEEAELEI